MHDTNPHEQQRQVRGLAIASIGSCIKRINKLRYKVKSQSDAWKWYEVVKQYIVAILLYGPQYRRP